MKRPSAFSTTAREPAAVRTGEHCPRTGWWYPLQAEPAATVQAPRFVGQGSVMPAVDGSPSEWLPALGS
ncbi:hypothetical protein ACFUTU_00955 [Arthrobacter sp. NPDC057388]|uniref:hypothetical protein n=1 Tax=Arthrobacter sp. NPDC057388 TaxID=3346116 RepID=UPI00362DF18C